MQMCGSEELMITQREFQPMETMVIMNKRWNNLLACMVEFWEVVGQMGHISSSSRIGEIVCFPKRV
jgi:hypothetical protein